MPLIKLFLAICLFRKGPQDIPLSAVLLKLSLTIYAVVGLILTGLETGLPEAALQVLLEMGMMLGFVWISLKAAGKLPRLTQTMTAMLGTDALISSLAIPLLALLKGEPPIPIAHLLLLSLTFWHIAVISHILRHALSQSLGLGIGLAIVYLVASYQIMMLLFGVPTPSN